ncbi:hypothetical protein A2422_00770 [Candidatus Woesebacteria bacterium RIFOXYC1_FULL_31_51]|uniref:Alpha-L-glutamate ligase, RimK family n=1 Tax=Candidatus Woesebacteria bacterium GW2011_GWC2_31_9 TaxID=1618586 RepID=A0A0F9YLU1_9BACT|nr:MAG: Alpha-L-glutamate ligase, RimK family [Candidatus Woesebacteria bacterium GW2011_GWF1_31_35]KKP22850.1 MAG: Alpha-L-glutamate ligase, RimK family [Candidatus Woesebacteria bacterium GW2011_GWC1_30_29]KKP26662.1 MAG: Alpha-L-glutamate ligase, RimK family [Candidatus Woesebacteria bacterium GW2011_GWD1_31_12]KKP28098.1 MAG: Alpha-L-glutamate ligase, RimK family [Candidatus Woesebacteria bacterium GW2011_GWB1_31_29]KKP32233.1 MAG: Alpha-L-glutamate ligase, RimK family [Candidatus Woesebact
MVNSKKILILTSGKVEKLNAFKSRDVVLASFNEINFSSENKELFVGVNNLKDFKLIYFRMVGKSLETASLVVNFSKENKIKIIDRMYESSNLLPISLGKTLEMTKLLKSNIPIPKTVFGDFSKLNFPYVVKSTTGQRGREVWLINNNKDLVNLKKTFKDNKFYFAQELILNARRIRVLVVGKKVIGAISRPTKWNKAPEKLTINPIPENIKKLALDATCAVSLDICGVDILINDTKPNKMWVIEVNAAPSWNLINKFCGISVEDEIIKFLQKQV